MEWKLVLTDDELKVIEAALLDMKQDYKHKGNKVVAAYIEQTELSLANKTRLGKEKREQEMYERRKERRKIRLQQNQLHEA